MAVKEDLKSEIKGLFVSFQELRYFYTSLLNCEQIVKTVCHSTFLITKQPLILESPYRAHIDICIPFTSLILWKEQIRCFRNVCVELRHIPPTTNVYLQLHRRKNYCPTEVTVAYKLYGTKEELQTPVRFIMGMKFHCSKKLRLQEEVNRNRCNMYTPHINMRVKIIQTRLVQIHLH